MGGSHRAGLIFVYYHYYSIGVSSTNFLQKKKKRKQSSTASADVRGSVLAPQRAPDQGPESCALLSARFPVRTKTDFSMWDLRGWFPMCSEDALDIFSTFNPLSVELPLT